MSAAIEGLRITKLERDPAHGFWRARATAGGRTVEVDCRYGSWQVVERHRGSEVGRRFATPALAEALSARVRPLERRDRSDL